MTSPERGRVLSLDGLRGTAILMVMFHHFTILIPYSAVEFWWRELSEMGRYGVDLFFVLSGFLITNILTSDRGDPHYFRTFYIRRALRIFPLYYFVVLFSLAVLPRLIPLLPEHLAKPVQAQTSADHWLWYAAYGTNFLIALKDKYTHGILDVGWSLCIEEHFYLIWPCLVYVFGNKALKNVCALTIVASLGLRFMLWSAGCSRLQIYMLTLTRIDMILFGALLALIASESSPHSTPRKKLFCAMTGVLVVALAVAGHFNYESRIMNTAGYSLIGMFFVQLVDLCAHSKAGDPLNKAFSHPTLRFFGKYSYALYLFHLPAAYVTKYALFGGGDFHSLPGPAIMWQFLFYGAATTLSVALALASWNLLEKPALSLKERFTYATGPKL